MYYYFKATLCNNYYWNNEYFLHCFLKTFILLNINYNNQIEIEDMSLNIDRLNEIVENDIVNLIDELREEEEVEEEVVSSEYVPVEEN